MKYTVKVTDQHIRLGETCSANSCPIALALKDIGLKMVSVDGDRAIFRISDTKYSMWLPEHARQFVADFDDDKEVKPLYIEADAQPLYSWSK